LAAAVPGTGFLIERFDLVQGLWRAKKPPKAFWSEGQNKHRVYLLPGGRELNNVAKTKMYGTYFFRRGYN
jgi:hypothetical protein